ncbi:bifunctional diguanylate cyclase/phosphodiesterase [Paenibacillus sp. HWE-109]|uniref:putative bifunctional diguanylate cyclase/phosphodiesterase n=1 Tax=Paenibacillus sp. HWE-109 TaxID=1306526 RepID=UPI001EDCFEA3|nr:bifunctional diguanylate cyclase/phosphodiesterase [Paenibacillus sp. HWE-109]UKS27280.1 bifunctional diguanylate cyclase/phosphodiesterase [Paenibacillus sp. HWE-109]
MKAVWRLFHLATATTLGTLRSTHQVTRIHHRHNLQDLIHKAIRPPKRVSSASSSCVLLMLDIDRFRHINASFGYRYGDLLLHQVAERLQTVPHCDLVVQTGDDEFGLLLCTESQEQMASLTYQVQHLFDKPFLVMEQICYINVSIGTSQINPSVSIEEAMHQADRALLAAKQTGKNKLVAYHSLLQQPFSNQVQMETELRQAIIENQLMLYYQPRLELSTGNIICLEALVRWNHPTLGLVPPNEFIPLAEESGLILPLGEWVLREACLQKVRWLEAGILNYQIAVNISPCQFQDEGFSDKAIHIIEKTGIDPSYLEFEITESSIMQNMETTIAVLEKLCTKGISISIDDFGIGYSSLNYLKHFPIHCLKIDRSFVQNIQCNKDDLAITTAIIHLGHALNVQVVAEGVEELSQLEILKETTCTTIQGYLLSPPVSVYEIERSFDQYNNRPVMIS